MEVGRAGFLPVGAAVIGFSLTFVSEVAAEAAAEAPAEVAAGGVADVTADGVADVTAAPPRQSPQRPTLPGLVVRAGAEYSWLRYALPGRGGRLGPGVNTSFENDFQGSSGAWGAHFLGGVGVEVSPALRIVPLLAGSVHSLGKEDFSLTVAGPEHRWSASLTYWTLAAGCELQFINRMLLLSFEVGGASLQTGAADGESPELQVELDDLGGVYGRAGVGFRFPADFPLGGGLMTGFDGMLSLSEFAVAYRVSGGLFLEFDVGRL